MCGITGYIGSGDAVPVIIDGLKRLEYRGYDSSGIAIVDADRIWLTKKEGRLFQLEDLLRSHPQSSVGIGHTRWATHGVPSDANAHPHTDCSGEIAVVHNGIIENYARLRRELQERGHVFSSDTDTEVLAHLIEEHYRGSLPEAVRAALAHVDGSYALAVIAAAEPDKIVAARRHSPLVVGVGQGEYYLASDIPAILNRTRSVYFLEDGDMAVLTPRGVTISDCGGRAVDKELFTVTWDAGAAEKDGHPHFMIKEILEQPRALRDTLRGRLRGARVEFPESELAQLLQGVEKIFITACGTAYHAGMVGKQVIERLARVPVEVDIASEFRYRDVLWGEKSLLLVISQSGETADTLAAMREARRRGVKVLAVTNVVGSSVAREADLVLYTWAGPEIAVASTKAYSTQLLLMYLLGTYLAQQRGSLPAEEIARLVRELAQLPERVEEVLEQAPQVECIADKYALTGSTFFIGRGLDYKVALEGALKLKEISYIHAEAYAAGELKHGTLALIEPGVPVIALATQHELEDKTLSNVKEVKARGAVVIGLTTQGLSALEEESDELIVLPAVDPLLAPILAVVPLQLFAYYMAVKRGCDVDKPRNLAKSVTVE